MFDAYMKFLDTTYKQLMEEEKKDGIIVDYAAYGASPRSSRVGAHGRLQGGNFRPTPRAILRVTTG